MRDLATLTAGDFEPFVGEEFDVRLDGSDSIRITLTRVRSPRNPSDGPRPFAVHFVGPRTPVLTHEIHTLVNPDFGELEIFVGPVVGRNDGTTYEAVFT